MKTNEQVIKEIYDAMQVNKEVRAKCNIALSDAISFVQHTEKVVHDQLDEQYKRGMYDAWEIIKNLYRLGKNECENIFGFSFVAYIVENYTPDAAKAKIDSYNKEINIENDDIHVGDIVQDNNDNTKATILDHDADTDLDKKYWMVFTENGCVESWHEADFSKTGESVDVNSVLIK